MSKVSNSFALTDVMDFTVESFSAAGRGNILFSVDYAAETSLNTTGEREPISGGIGGYKILDFDHSTACEFVASLPIIDIHALATKLGRKVKEGQVTVPMDEYLPVQSDGTVTLTKTPKANTLKVYQVGFDRDILDELKVASGEVGEGGYQIEDQQITVDKEEFPAGSFIFASYDYESGESSQSVNITASDFPRYITIRGRGFADDAQAGVRVPIAFRVHKAKVRPGMELSMANATPTVLDLTCDCYTVVNAEGAKEFVDIIKLNDEVIEG